MSMVLFFISNARGAGSTRPLGWMINMKKTKKTRLESIGVHLGVFFTWFV